MPIPQRNSRGRAWGLATASLAVGIASHLGRARARARARARSAPFAAFTRDLLPRPLAFLHACVVGQLRGSGGLEPVSRSLQYLHLVFNALADEHAVLGIDDHGTNPRQ